MIFDLEKKPHNFMEELASKLKTIRKQSCITQSELAERSGVSLGSIKRFEHTGEISLKSLLQVAEILNRLNDFDLILKPTENIREVEKLFSDKTRL